MDFGPYEFSICPLNCEEAWRHLIDLSPPLTLGTVDIERN